MNLSNQPHPDEILVLGVGNPLLGDDGAGIRAIEMLSERDLPPNVELLDAGTPGWGLPSLLEGHSSVVLIDAVQMGGTPGTWRRFRPDEVRLMVQDEALSLHQPDLACGLALAQALDMTPENLLFYGIEPGDTGAGSTLSPQVSSSLPAMVASIANDLGIGKA